ncbi:hypothetical protein ACJ41O_009210 [Fusarium nematophilum]
MASRSKTGCITCRIRRVKCDETRPQCKRCQSAKRICDGYLSDDNAMPRRQLAKVVKTLSVVGPVSRALTSSPSSSNPVSRPVSPNDTIYFDLFRYATVPGTCSVFPSGFWQEGFLQMAHGEPAVWHAAVALGTLHQRMEGLSLKQNDETLVKRAMAHYGKAMALAKDLDSPAQVVTLSIALVAAASMLGWWSEMQTHVMAGLRIVARDGTDTSGLGSLMGSLMRIDVLAMTFSDSSSPYPYAESTSVFTTERFLMTPSPEEISYEELSSEFFGIVRTFLLLDDGILSGNVPHGPWLTKFDALVRRVSLWESRMAGLEASRQPTHREQTTSLSLRLYHIILRTFLRSTSFGHETRYDDLLGYFEYAIRLAATLQERMRTGALNTVGLSLEPGIIVPLWVVIHRCRHYKLRHAALKILTEVNRVEGMWRSDATAAVLGTLAKVEEETLGVVDADVYTPTLLDASSLSVPWSSWSRPIFDLPTTVSWDDVPLIPEEKRVKEILGVFTEGCVQIQLLMCPNNDEEPYGGVREFSVKF